MEIESAVQRTANILAFFWKIKPNTLSIRSGSQPRSKILGSRDHRKSESESEPEPRTPNPNPLDFCRKRIHPLTVVYGQKSSIWIMEQFELYTVLNSQVLNTQYCIISYRSPTSVAGRERIIGLLRWSAPCYCWRSNSRYSTDKLKREWRTQHVSIASLRRLLRKTSP